MKKYFMKKRVIFVLLVFGYLCFQSCLIKAVEPGDLNSDGSINSLDYMLLNRFILGEESNIVFEAADLDGSLSVNSSDLSLMRRYVLGLISEFPDNVEEDLSPPNFSEVSVHDPSVIKTGEVFWIFGSHLASAYSHNLREWSQFSHSVHNNNSLIPNVYQELGEVFEWARTDTLWAGDVIQLEDGNYYMYYCACEGSSPLSVIGLAVSSNIRGPYVNRGMFLRSGMNGTGEDGSYYNAQVHPNAIDPHVFYDHLGELWMVYGSYSGGIYILKLNPETGLPFAGQGYGKKLTGGNHSRIEAPYILYSPETEYYYLFLSFGGLSADGGYNIRVARSENADGPYYDPQGNNLLDAMGPAGSFFDDRAVEPYGAKLMGNFRFNNSKLGYVSPGHNSAYYDAEKGMYFLIFHTRFPGRGEFHNVRVHQMFMNSEGWPVTAPHRYAGERLRAYTAGEVAGRYQLINHGLDISSDVKNSLLVELKMDGKITGDLEGNWKKTGQYTVDISIDGKTYYGVFSRNWDQGLKKYIITFSALSREGISIWGSQII